MTASHGELVYRLSPEPLPDGRRTALKNALETAALLYIQIHGLPEWAMSEGARYSTSNQRFLWEAENAWTDIVDRESRELRMQLAAAGKPSLVHLASVLEGPPPPAGVATVYRHFDQLGTLLYVGLTENFGNRQVQHRRTSPWWSTVARVTTKTFDNRDTAARAEAAAITLERPVYNLDRADSE